MCRHCSADVCTQHTAMGKIERERERTFHRPHSHAAMPDGERDHTARDAKA